MGLLAVEHPLMLDRTVAAPVADRGKGIIGNVLRHRPVGQYHWLERWDPGESTGRHRASGPSDVQADRYEMRMAGETPVDALHLLPKLVEAGIKVEVNADRDPRRQCLVGKHAGDVDQDIRSTRDLH